MRVGHATQKECSHVTKHMKITTRCLMCKAPRVLKRVFDPPRVGHEQFLSETLAGKYGLNKSSINFLMKEKLPVRLQIHTPQCESGPLSAVHLSCLKWSGNSTNWITFTVHCKRQEFAKVNPHAKSPT